MSQVEGGAPEQKDILEQRVPGREVPGMVKKLQGRVAKGHPAGEVGGVRVAKPMGLWGPWEEFWLHSK